MKKQKIKILFLLLLGIALLVIPNKVKASSFINISAPSTVAPGQSFTVTISLPNAAGKVNASVSNGSGSLNEFVDGSASFTCVAGNSGKVTINASSSDICDYNEVQHTDSASYSVAISSGSTSNGSSSSSSTGTSTSTTNNSNNNSSSAKLTSLTVDGAKVTINNSMSKTVESSKDSVNISAKGNGTCSVVCRGINNPNVKLDAGSNKITITVTTDGQTKSYTLNVIRLAEESNIANVDDSVAVNDENTVVPDEEQSNDLKLKTLNIKDFNLDPEFNPDVYEYKIDVDMDKNDISSLDIEALADDGIEVKVIGNSDLIEGENVITILLKKGDEQAVYQIIVNKIKSSSETEGNAQKVKNALLGLSTPKKVALGAGTCAVVAGALTAVVVVCRKKNNEIDMVQEVNDDEEIGDDIDDCMNRIDATMNRVSNDFSSENEDEQDESLDNNEVQENQTVDISNEKDDDMFKWNKQEKEDYDFKQYQKLFNNVETENNENKSVNEENSINSLNSFENNETSFEEKYSKKSKRSFMNSKKNRKGKHSM